MELRVTITLEEVNITRDSTDAKKIITEYYE